MSTEGMGSSGHGAGDSDLHVSGVERGFFYLRQMKFFCMPFLGIAPYKRMHNVLLNGNGGH